MDPSKLDLVYVVAENGRPDSNATGSWKLGKHGSEAEQLLDLKHRLIHHVQHLTADAVAVYGTARYGNWKLADLQPRVKLESALLIAAAELSIPVYSVTPHEAAKAVGVAFSRIPDELAHEFDSAVAKKDRCSRALAAARAAGSMMHEAHS